MKYTILEIKPGILTVEFEDRSWANVVIPPNASLEDIDDAVSEYDPDFRAPLESITPSGVNIGEERTSTKKVTEEVEEEQPVSNTFSPSMPLISFGMHSGGDVMAMAEYFASKGDNSLKEYVMTRVENYINENNLTVDSIKENIQSNDSNDNIVAQAEAELNADG